MPGVRVVQRPLCPSPATRLKISALRRSPVFVSRTSSAEAEAEEECTQPQLSPCTKPPKRPRTAQPRHVDVERLEQLLQHEREKFSDLSILLQDRTNELQILRAKEVRRVTVCVGLTRNHCRRGPPPKPHELVSGQCLTKKLVKINNSLPKKNCVVWTWGGGAVLKRK